MGTKINLNKGSMSMDTGLDSIVIVHFIEGIPGGRSLDVTGFAPTVIKGGHVVIKSDTDETYKPMPVNSAGDAYDTLPSGYKPVGVTITSTVTDEAMVGIMVRGTVNTEASPYPVTEAIKTALPLIRFTKD